MGYSRRKASRNYRSRFVLITEGQTEIAYFEDIIKPHLKSDKYTFIPSRNSHSDPKSLLKEMRSQLSKSPLKKGDEAWILFDRDKWTNEQIEEVLAWAKDDQKFYAVSIPKFEFWLLLHFEKGRNLTSRQCDNALAKHLPQYHKNKTILPRASFDILKIKDAINNAIAMEKNAVEDCFDDFPCSSVYKLVKKLIKE